MLLHASYFVGGTLPLLWSFVAVTRSSTFGSSSMPPTVLSLQMMIDFADVHDWRQVVVFDCIGSNDCTRPYAKSLVECFWRKGILVAMNSLTDETNLSRILNVETHRVGVILFLDDVDLHRPNNLLRRFNKMIGDSTLRSTIFGDYASWLLLSTKWNSSQIFDAVRDWPIGVDSDVSVAMSFLTADVIFTVFHQLINKTCPNLRNYGERYDYARLRRSQSVAPAESIFVQDTLNPTRTLMVFYTVVVYKIRIDSNSSLQQENWNTWSPSRKFPKELGQTRRQRDFRKHIMNIGFLNSSLYYGDVDVDYGESSEQISCKETLHELIDLFELCLNITKNVTNYAFHEATQTTKETNDLVHGIDSGEVDLGAAYFDVDYAADKTIEFSFPIARFYRGIYFKPPEISNNIFLRPFSPELMGCVVLTLLLFVGVMEIINYITLYIHWQEDAEHFGLGEAALWCISIMCTQGSPWTPKTRAGKAVLLCSLFFSLIIYNSYSGFITSILSVKTDSIKNVTDFANYPYTYGCSKIDDTYISEARDELRNFYMRALESEQTKVPEKEGLERTLNGNYVFFVSESVAKRMFRNVLRFQRCKIVELQTKTTHGALALPMPENSPYKKMINNGILRMWQYGMLNKLGRKIKPQLLDCMSVLEYQKARFTDVYGAFCILGVGAVAAVALFFLERAWIKRKRLDDAIRRRISGAKGNVKRNPAVLNTVRLPMKILGLNRELQNERDLANSELNFMGFRNVKRGNANAALQPFPYNP